jgi:hypothetical protein
MDELTNPQISFVQGSEPEELEDSIARAPYDPNSPSTAFVRLIDPHMRDALAKDAGARERALARTKLPIFVLTCEGRPAGHVVYRVISGGIERLGHEATDVLQRLCEHDLVALRQASRCHFEKTDALHFVAPSGKHCSRFVRVADMIRSKDALDRLAFWVRPKIAGVDAVLLDTWGIAAVALRAMQQDGSTQPFDCLEAHPADEHDATVQVLRALRDQCGDEVRVLCLVSILSSGTLAQRLIAALGELGCPWKLEVLGIYGFTGSGSAESCLCRLNENPMNVDPDNCEDCKDGSAPVQVDGHLYYVKSPKETEVTLTPTYFTQREFLERYISIPGALSVHRDSVVSRHHAFYIDVAPMLATSEFCGRLDERICELRARPDLILSNGQPGSLALAAKAGKTLNVPVVSYPSVHPGNDFPPDVALRINEAGRVLVIDEVFLSVRRMNAINDVIRRRHQGVRAVDWLVGVKRPRSQRAWEAAERALLTHHGSETRDLKTVETILLPDWGADHCPWCHEARFLKRISSQLGDPPTWLTERIESLARWSVLVQEPLICLPGVAVPVLGNKSPLGPAGASALFVLFAFASALQELRNHSDPTRRLAPLFPDLRVIDGVKALTNYNENLLRAAILRTVGRDEWGARQAGDRKQIVLDAVRERGVDVLAGELLIAQRRRIVPRLTEDEIRSIFAAFLDDRLLRAVIETA